MPKLLIRQKQDSPPEGPATAEASAQTKMTPPTASASPSADVSLMFALYKRCVEGGYPNCDILKQMVIDEIKKRLRAELAKLIEPEFRKQIGQICVEL
jgi:hypothetical protein